MINKKKNVYMFSEGNAKMREALGGKGANLCEMTNLGIPVPQGFIVSTSVCNDYYANDMTFLDVYKKNVFACLKRLEKITGKTFGDPENPLLLSVRSGARVSMPGMMDTILNLGVNDEIIKDLGYRTRNEWFSYDTYRRFIQMYSNVVKQIPMDNFENVLTQIKAEKNISKDSEFTVDDLKNIINQYKEIYKKFKNEDFPQDPKQQLIDSIEAVFRSWNSDRAKAYRKMHDIPSEWGTAVNVQQMVFGNMGDNCLTGVAFSRNPTTGDDKIYGEYLLNAQGEDIVSGVRTPESFDKLAKKMPEIYNEFTKYAKKLEKHYADMQDIEFTVENGKLYILQTRNGKRTPQASLKIAIDLVNEKLITKKEAISRLDVDSVATLLHSQFDKKALSLSKNIGQGLPASPGCAFGKIVFTSEEAKALNKQKEKCILVRQETSAEDIEGMHNAEGVVTARGGMTSHAAVLARGMGKPCVCGVDNLVINEDQKTLVLNGEKLKSGDIVSIDGATGKVYNGKIQTVPAKLNKEFKTILDWSKEIKNLGVFTNADNKVDAKQAFEYGAEGIGLCRTEHMFFAPERIIVMREMIVADTDEQRKNALNRLLPMQKADFKELFKLANGTPVTIRLLDPPLHEFLPKEDKEIKELASSLNISESQLRDKISDLKEVNPMMGHRGCRLDITYPEIAEMQTRAIIEASIEVSKKQNIKVCPEIMVPLTIDIKEFAYVKDIIDKTAKEIMEKKKCDVEYKVGSMIEVPRGAILADEIASQAEFFSFGTNDLTQLTYGFSRDDAGKFLDEYYKKNILPYDPFQRLDENGVGKLIHIAVTLSKKQRNDIVLGVCGEHGGNPESIDFCDREGLDYVSCSPYRVPIAIIASAQSAIKNGERN